MIVVIWSISCIKTISLKWESFDNYEEMLNFLAHHHYWWERLPFITRRFYRV